MVFRQQMYSVYYLDRVSEQVSPSHLSTLLDTARSAHTHSHTHTHMHTHAGWHMYTRRLLLFDTGTGY